RGFEPVGEVGRVRAQLPVDCVVVDLVEDARERSAQRGRNDQRLNFVTHERHPIPRDARNRRRIGEQASPRHPPDGSRQTEAVIVIPPRAFWRSEMCTLASSSSSAAATSSRIWTASASQKTPCSRKRER